MFYNHEILTSRKYGVATVWLVATLGAKSGQKRITRKQILDVDVTKACRTIIDPAAPMALRLQGNLLLGVSRVYLQQAGYVLSDAQSAQHTMLMLLRSVRNAELDSDAGKARPEQLILPDDPYFMPGFVLPESEVLIDLNLDFGFDISRSGDSQTMTPLGSWHSISSQSVGGLVLPSSSPHAPAEFQLHDGDGPNELEQPTGMLGGDDVLDLPEPEFTFDEDGDIIDLPVHSSAARTPGVYPGSAMQSDAGASEKVRRDHQEGLQAARQIPVDPMDIDLPILGNDLPEGSAFSLIGQQQGSEESEHIESKSSTSASMHRKHRAARTIPKDFETEIQNKELANWKANYLANMQDSSKRKINSHGIHQAKKNAEHYVWGRGIGGISEHLLHGTESHPFNMFIGDNLYELITGSSRQKAGRKRRKPDRDSGIDDATQEESRSIRQKTGDPGDQTRRDMEDEAFFVPRGDYDDAEVELPRETGTALDDQQLFSAMPWNISASKRGSSAVPRSGLSGRVASLDPSKRGSRVVSASPLLGRSQPIEFAPLHHFDSDADLALEGSGAALALSGDPTSSPVPTIAHHPPIRVHEALSAECSNFLTFLQDAISQNCGRTIPQFHPFHHYPVQHQQAPAEDTNEITFNQLLPPTENTRIIATQGLMMVLSLGSKDLLDVQQYVPFGDIHLKLKPNDQIIHSAAEEASADDALFDEQAHPAQDFPQDDDDDDGHDFHYE